jgi:hypothetical protein
MLQSDTPPPMLQNWEHGYLYLNYYSGGDTPIPTTVRMEFTPVAVPEPTAVALVGVGTVAVLWLGRPRRQ